MSKIDKNYFLAILFISLITLTFSSLRDIDFFGKNFDDKMGLYYNSVTDIEKDGAKKKIIKNLIKNNCKDLECEKRHTLRFGSGNNYLITKSIIQFFDKIIKNDNELIRISKVTNYSILLTLVLFYLSIIIISYKSDTKTKLHILFLLSLIFIIDKKLLYFDLGFVLPNFENYNNYLTEYVPRSQAGFFSTLSIIFCYNKKYFEAFILIIIAFLFHFAIGASILLIFFVYYFFLKLQNFFLLEKIFFKVILLFCLLTSIILNQFILIPLILFTFLICHKYKLNFHEKYFLCFLILVISGLFFLNILFVYLKYIISSSSNANYLTYILPSINFEEISNKFQVLINSNFFYKFRHAPAYLSPIFIISYLIILIIKFETYFLKILKKIIFVNLKNKVILFFIIISFSPFLTERLIYLKNFSKMINEDLVIALEEEKTLENATKFRSIKFKNVNFNKEVFSQFMILKYLQGQIKYE